MNVAKIAPFNMVAQVSRIGGVAKTLPFRGGIDSVSFSSKSWDYKVLDEDSAQAKAQKLRKSTSGYRAPYNTEAFDKDFIFTMSQAVGEYAKEQGQKNIMVAGDLRQATKEGAPIVKGTFLNMGFDVMVPRLKDTPKGEIAPVASPILALATRHYDMPVSVLMTASHNPWSDGGYNFLTNEGAVATDKVTNPIGDKFVEIAKQGYPMPKAEKKGEERVFNPHELYAEHIKENDLIDFEAIKNSGLEIYYEGLEGTGNYYYPQLMEENGIKLAKTLDTKVSGPNPDDKNLATLADVVKKSDAKLKIGLATDGDSDRFGIVDENGVRLNNNDVLLLVAYHQIKNKGMKSGTIIRSNATSERLDRLAEYFNKKEGYKIDVEQTPVGFKYLGDKMLELEGTDMAVLVAGEESGGLTIRGHIPEKDGFVAISKIAELVAYENKPIGQILKDVQEEIGSDYVSVCNNAKFSGPDAENKKNALVDYFEKFKAGEEDEIAGYKLDVEKTREVDKHIREYRPFGDGTKIYFENGTTLLVRKSGTEPAVRLYIDATDENVFNDVNNYLNELVANI